MISFANEILLQVLSLLPLRALVAAQGVDQNWRQLVAAADVPPLHRELLDLYMALINSPWFLQTRPWVLKNLVPFDREEYVAALLAQYNPLPEAFTLWLLEWPARAVIGGVWPGLPLISTGSTDEIQVFRGFKWLSPRTVQVSAMTFTIPDSQKLLYDFLPGILIRSLFTNTWFVLDDDEYERERGALKLRGKVFVLYGGGTHLYDEFGCPGLDQVDNDWMAFLRRICNEVEARVKSGRGLDDSNPYFDPRREPSYPLWSARHTALEWVSEPGTLRVPSSLQRPR